MLKGVIPNSVLVAWCCGENSYSQDVNLYTYNSDTQIHIHCKHASHMTHSYLHSLLSAGKQWTDCGKQSRTIL